MISQFIVMILNLLGAVLIGSVFGWKVGLGAFLLCIYSNAKI